MEILLPQNNNIDTIHLQRLFDDTSECYKLYWFQAIVNEIVAGKRELSFDELINNMIADAWYSVSEYRLNLGPRDNLEYLIQYAQQASNLKSSEKREKIIEYIATCKDSTISAYKTKLIYNVPFRLQAPFLHFSSTDWNGSMKKLAESINQKENIIYKFVSISGLNSKILVNNDWAEYIIANADIIRGWIQYNLIIYLQRRNPSVPGIPNKIKPPQERKLELVKKFWNSIIELEPIRDIYGNNELERNKISIDHFIPWSYVAHDELWNLNPTTREINSSKSNHLPDWNSYFPKLCELEYKSYSLVWQFEPLHDQYEKCLREHVNSVDVQHKMYRVGLDKEEFFSQLEEIILPVFKDAVNLGFEEWKLN